MFRQRAAAQARSVRRLPGSGMGMLTELFIGSEEDARTYGPASASQFDALQLGGLTDLEFGTLWAILEGVKWDAKKHVLRKVAATAEQWTFAFPESYLDRLRSLPASELPSAASMWASRPEINAGADEVEPVIEQLVQLAREATERKQSLFLWVSL